MAAYNLENNIREKLENREIKPSHDAWKKLESQLDKKQPKKKSKTWYYIAASLAGLLVAVSIFFNQNSFEGENSLVIENDPHKSELPTVTNTLIIPSSEERIEGKSNTKKDKAESKSDSIRNKELKPSPHIKQSAIDKKIKKIEALAISQEDRLKREKSTEETVKQKDIVIITKVDEIVSSGTLIVENEETSSEEVDRLLHNARRNIQTHQILNSPRIDAAALLDEAEWELEKSFRDKVFEAFGEGYQKLRTAISQRND
ncbi:hypothetical protein EI546_07685 [Aequorivita sp. H23M31]|uniref:Uncharacterized protein n=1 Tax=Aequorivita ciconiae TaxID=2494375 RepID=A0A410G2W1_9FLAO|nr:hypothetical protein [Aequorivita sp. H23M31]QAA81612.1 hypothetical protein EI546_07685 [Aequorivita sp. H23M31]